MEDKLVLALAVLVVVVVVSKLVSYATRPRLNLPPGPWTLPVIGSIHHLVGGHSIQRSMQRLAEKHGPLMKIWLGEVFAVVVSSPEAAQEIMKTHDVVFADRFVSTTVGTITFGGSDLAWAPYGERWRQLRKLCTLELLTAARVRSFRRIREEEVARLVRDLAASAAAGEAVNLSDKMAKLVNDIIVRCCVGGRSKHRDEFLDALRTALDQTTWLTVADIFPSSKLARMLGAAPRKALACRKKIEHILEQIIQERREIMDRSSGDGGEAAAGSECFVDVLLRLQKEGDTPIPITNEIIVVLLFDIVSGGSETSSITLNWIMADLIQTPRVMAKVCDEVRKTFQGKNNITEDDSVSGLTYLKMVTKESLRMHCPVPLLGTRKCRETCKIMGYDIPKDTTIFVNAWAICRDPKYWDDTDKFKPERFENNNIDYKGNNFEFLPFGSGRRMCAGINLGMANVELPLASILYHFDWKLPNGMLPEDVDMQEVPGLLANRRTSLTLFPVTRVAPRDT
ncbi:ent-cassadiene hydroxylase-like [Oryza brachyantha]|uniref:ent-cassadiene hydroxylase-like n=1 Tax=Oryza brachyantha TaxID=4533 RepID=UPI001ADAD4FE|nr:ent-cassadiene hydroxylase-like [Oryza brachyantha]